MSSGNQEKDILGWLEIPVSSEDDLDWSSDDSSQDRTFIPNSKQNCDSSRDSEIDDNDTGRPTNKHSSLHSSQNSHNGSGNLSTHSDNSPSQIQPPCRPTAPLTNLQKPANTTNKCRNVVWKEQQLFLMIVQVSW